MLQNSSLFRQRSLQLCAKAPQVRTSTMEFVVNHADFGDGAQVFPPGFLEASELKQQFPFPVRIQSTNALNSEVYVCTSLCICVCISIYLIVTYVLIYYLFIYLYTYTVHCVHMYIYIHLYIHVCIYRYISVHSVCVCRYMYEVYV